MEQSRRDRLLRAQRQPQRTPVYGWTSSWRSRYAKKRSYRQIREIPWRS